MKLAEVIQLRRGWEFSIDREFRVAFRRVTPPNWFHRLMQRWFLGIYWREVK